MGAEISKPDNNKHQPYASFLLRSTQIPKTLCDAPPAPPPPAVLPPPPLPSDGKSSSPEAPPPPPPSAEEASISEAAAAVSNYTNPGPYEQVQLESKRLVTLDTFDGFRCDISKQLSPYMAVVHNFWLGTNMIPDGRKKTYTFITQVADETGMTMARVDPERFSVDGRIHRALLNGLVMSKTQVGVSKDGQADQLLTELDFGALTWTGNLKYGTMGGGTIYGCNYLQAITPKLCMGGEGMFISANQNLISSYFVKYTIPAKTGEEDTEIVPTKSPNQAAAQAAQHGPLGDDSGSSTFYGSFNTGQGALSLSYKRVVTPNRVTLGADLQCSPFNLESQVLLGAEFKLSRSRVHVCVDGTGKVQSIVEAKLGMVPGSPSINFSGEIDHGKDDMKFGFGINFESS